MGNEIIKISRQELMSSEDHNKKLEEQNFKLVALRKKHVYNMLKEATISRIKTSRNISNWIKMLSEKIFNPETINEMDLNKAIALFKYVNNINLKVLSESNRLEEILSKYIESGAMDTADKLNKETGSNEREKVKQEILSRLNKMFKETSEEVDATPVEEPSSLSDEEFNELEDAERKLEENLAAIDQEIEYELDPIEDADGDDS